MSDATNIVCPHCQATNAAGAQFCESCGKALPAAVSAGPRIIDSSSFASTAAGHKLQSDELQKLSKKASKALIAVAIIQTVIASIIIGIAQANNRSGVIMQNAA